eukprot:scaffold102974_cov20-Prasinocladus_malaysianus.AAC.1
MHFTLHHDESVNLRLNGQLCYPMAECACKMCQGKCSCHRCLEQGHGRAKVLRRIKLQLTLSFEANPKTASQSRNLDTDSV